LQIAEYYSEFFQWQQCSKTGVKTIYYWQQQTKQSKRKFVALQYMKLS